MRTKGPLLSRLTHANETKNATHTITFLIVVIFKSISISIINYVAIVLVFSKSRNGSKTCTRCEQRFLSCMAFSVYEVICVASLSHSWFDYSPQTSHENNLIRTP